MAHVEIHNSVPRVITPGEWQLRFQQVTYHYDDGSEPDVGFRFIWARDDGTLQAARGQARIPTGGDLRRLIEEAEIAGWFEA